MADHAVTPAIRTSKAVRAMLSDFYVYVLFRLDGEPFYVGKGRGRRWKFHATAASRERSHKAAIIRQIVQTCAVVPMVKVRERLTELEAFETEVALIRAIGRQPFGPLTNCTDGGEGQAGASAETRAKIAAARAGRPLPLEHRESLSKALKAYVQTAEHIEAAAAGNRGKVRTLEQIENLRLGQIGKVITSEHRANLSRALTGRTFSAEHRANIAAANRRRGQNTLA